jgi:hypothetical protein
MKLKDYYEILGVDSNARLSQLDSKFKEHVDRIKLIDDKEKGIKEYLEIFEAYFILRQEKPKVVYEECLDKIKDKDSKVYSVYEASLREQFQIIIDSANIKAIRNFNRLDKVEDGRIITDMIMEALVGTFLRDWSYSTLGILILLMAILLSMIIDLGVFQYLFGVIAVFCSLWVFVLRFKHLKIKKLFDD